MAQENFRNNNEDTSTDEDKKISSKENEKILSKQEEQKETERLTGSQDD